MTASFFFCFYKTGVPGRVWTILCVLVCLTSKSLQQMGSCTYGARGSLMSTCTNAYPSLFRSTSYRFDNLDETVRCLNCKLKVLESNTFDLSGNQIKTLNLTNSMIETLKPKAFIGLVFLKRLILANNHISAVPASTFQGINKVERLDLQDNAITGLVVSGFNELVNLRQLNLKNNQIATVEQGSFDGLGSLEELDLGNNNIGTLKDIFRGLLNVNSINLESNRISQIDPSDMGNLDSLLYLNLAKNTLKSIPEAAFLSLQRLETLNLSRNPISTLALGSFRGLYSLEDLDLSRCSIPNVPKGLLQALYQLRNLDLSNNRIPTFSTGVYSGIPELRKLNLSHNQIEKYQKTGVLPLHSLHTLDVSFNKLKDLDYKRLVNHLPKLSNLQLNNNPWPCSIGKDMEEYFKNDNLVFTLDKQYEDPNIQCNDSKPIIIEDDPVTEAVPNTAMLVSDSNGHEYVLYVFICVVTGLMVFLFYLQFRNQKDIRDMIGKTNISEVQLLSSSDLEARDDF